VTRSFAARCLLLALSSAGCSELRSEPLLDAGTDDAPAGPDAPGDLAAGSDAPAGDGCTPGKFSCGGVCRDCCANGDCPLLENSEGTCSAEGLCAYGCRAGSERCRGTCQMTFGIVGGCLAAAGEVSPALYWCDPEEVDERQLLWRVDRRRAMERGHDLNDPALLDSYCLGISDSMLGNYCTTGRHAAGRRARMDTVYVYSLRFDADGKLLEQHRTPGSRSRTCQPP
jgi:hypothetical protein